MKEEGQIGWDGSLNRRWQVALTGNRVCVCVCVCANVQQVLRVLHVTWTEVIDWQVCDGLWDTEACWLSGFLLRWHHLGSDWPSFLRARTFEIISEETVQQVEAGTQNEALKRTCWIMHGCVKERIFISLLLLNHLPLLFSSSSSSSPSPSLSLLHQLKWLCGFMRQPFKSLPFPHWSSQKVIGSIKRIKSPGKME